MAEKVTRTAIITILSRESSADCDNYTVKRDHHI